LRGSSPTTAAVGDGRLGATRCTQVVDMRGRTAVPGLIDNHNHVVLLGLRPGLDTHQFVPAPGVLRFRRARCAWQLKESPRISCTQARRFSSRRERITSSARMRA
jgi:predicted amidohydrolase YtcJ